MFVIKQKKDKAESHKDEIFTFLRKSNHLKENTAQFVKGAFSTYHQIKTKRK